MSLLRFLGLGHDAPAAGAGAETETVRRVVAALDRMEPEAARYVARFAYVLGRVAGADQGVSSEETRIMERTVMERGGLTEEQAILAVQIAKSQQALFGGTEDYLVTREFASTATYAPEAGAAPLLHGGRGGRCRGVGSGGRGRPRDRGRAGSVARRVHRGPLRVP